MQSDLTKQAIIDAAKDLNPSGLSSGKSGNISVRHGDGFPITPSAVAYEDLNTDDIVLCDQEGRVLNGDWQPSSEWPFHAAIYQQRCDINAIVHTHSCYATALACNRQSIPAFHYMVAVAGGKSIECAEYATSGTEILSNNVIIALGNRRACLMANHRQVAVGEALEQAYVLAHEVETLARQYTISLQIGKTVLLDDTEMDINLEKFKHYGKQHRL